ncbi:MAG: HU family DNA-binding protein [Bacteroidales bacterium]
MNRKITLPELVEALTVVTNTTKRVSETFLRELFALISEQLISGESVKIKGLGVFKVVTVDARRSVDVNTGEEIVIAAHNKVSFTADKELAEAVNMPFASFETVVLNDDIPELEMKRIEADVDIDIEQETEVTEVAIEPLSEIEIETEDVHVDVVPEEIVEEVTDEVVETDLVTDIEPETVVEEVADEVIIEPEVVEDDTADNDIGYSESLVTIADESDMSSYVVVAKVGKRKFISGYMWGFISAILFAGIAFVIINFNINITPKIEDKEELTEVITHDVSTPVADEVVLVDTITSNPSVETEGVEEIKVVTKPKVVYDTITRTRFMATMAREHYGNMNFWVYIYEENMAKISNPSVIAPGTVLVIPTAEKYGINANDPESVRTAEIKSKAFNARYK